MERSPLYTVCARACVCVCVCACVHVCMLGPGARSEGEAAAMILHAYSSGQNKVPVFNSYYGCRTCQPLPY